jgi:hypothetical protein
MDEEEMRQPLTGEVGQDRQLARVLHVLALGRVLGRLWVRRAEQCRSTLHAVSCWLVSFVLQQQQQQQLS